MKTGKAQSRVLDLLVGDYGFLQLSMKQAMSYKSEGVRKGGKKMTVGTHSHYEP